MLVDGKKPVGRGAAGVDFPGERFPGGQRYGLSGSGRNDGYDGGRVSEIPQDPHSWFQFPCLDGGTATDALKLDGRCGAGDGVHGVFLSFSGWYRL